jgi:hypothetical protein
MIPIVASQKSCPVTSPRRSNCRTRRSTESFPVIHSIVLIVPRTQGLGKEFA